MGGVHSSCISHPPICLAMVFLVSFPSYSRFGYSVLLHSLDMPCQLQSLKFYVIRVVVFIVQLIIVPYSSVPIFLYSTLYSFSHLDIYYKFAAKDRFFYTCVSYVLFSKLFKFVIFQDLICLGNVQSV